MSVRWGRRSGLVARLLAVLMLSGALWPVAQPARAADELLVSSDPYEHQELTDPPSGVVLAFSRTVDAAAAQIVVTNSAGANVNINTLDVDGTNVTAQVKPNLPEDTYTVHYRVNRKDGQVEGGAFQFSYGTGHWTDLPDRRWSGNSAEPSVVASPPEDGQTPEPTDEASVPVASPSVEPSATSTATAAPATGGASPVPWIVGGVGVVVVAAVAGGVLLTRRRRDGK